MTSSLRADGPPRQGTGRGARLAMRAVVVAGLILLTGIGIWPGALPQASAHAVLVHSSPLDGATVPSNPGRVTLTFDESIGLIPGVDQVISTDGARADVGSPSLSADGTTITMLLRPDLPNGTYSAVWRVVSADTHVVSGSITFGIGVAPGSTTPAVADRTAGLGTIDQVGQGLGYAGLVLLVGLPASAALLWPWALSRRRLRGWVRAGWAAVAAGAVAQLLVQGPRADNLPLRALARLPGLGQTISTAFGIELLVRLAALVAIGLLLTRRTLSRLAERRPAVFAAIPAAVLVGTMLLAGHAATGIQIPLALAATALHILAMTLWFGGLVCLCLLVLSRAAPSPDIPTLRRWSVVAFACIAALVVTGEYQAWRQVAPLPALWSTEYGVTLLIKLAAVAAAVAIAWFSQRAVHGALSRGRLILRGAVTAEIAVAVVILAVTSVLVSEPPARTSYGPPVTMTASAGPDQLVVTVTPTLHGPQTLTIDAVDRTGRPTPAQQMTVTMASASVASLAVAVSPSADRTRWTSDRLIVPLPGVWTVTVTVALGASEAYATSASYQVW